MGTFNPASRLYTLCTYLSGQDGNREMLALWAKALEVDTDTPGYQFEVAERLKVARDEAERAYQLVRAAGMSPQLYDTAFQRVYAVLTVMTLPAQWSAYKGNLDEITLHTLRWCGEIVSDTEQEADPTQIAELKEMLSEWAAELRTADLPEEIRGAVQGYLLILQRAAALYALRGVQAFRTAESEAAVHMMVNRSTFDEAASDERAKPHLEKMKMFWRMLEGLTTLAQLASSVQSLLPPGLTPLK